MALRSVKASKASVTHTRPNVHKLTPGIDLLRCQAKIKMVVASKCVSVSAISNVKESKVNTNRQFPPQALRRRRYFFLPRPRLGRYRAAPCRV